MKNYKNYIKEHKDYQIKYEENTLAFKLQTALDKPGDNDKEIRELIGDFDYEEYKYDYIRSKRENDTDQLTITFISDTDLPYILGVEDYDLSIFIDYMSNQGDFSSGYYIDIEEVYYHLNNDNKELFIKVLNLLNIGTEKNYEFDENIFRLFFKTFNDKKIVDDIEDELVEHIDNFMNACKEKMASSAQDKILELGFFLTSDKDKDGEDIFEIVFDLKKIDNNKTLYEIFKKNELSDSLNFNEFEIDEKAETEMEKNVQDELNKLYDVVKENKAPLLEQILLKYNIADIKTLGGDVLKMVMSYEYQKKYINNKLENLKKLIEIEIVNKKIMEDFGYLITLNNFNI